jgi:hypothetical protein
MFQAWLSCRGALATVKCYLATTAVALVASIALFREPGIVQDLSSG